jgi:hygromycin-B 4-O-kinase
VGVSSDLLQPVLDIDDVRALLERWAGGAVGGVSQFSNGQVSSVFGFEVLGDGVGLRVSGGKYVVRFVSSEYGGAVRKDRFIAPRAAAVGVPVPRSVVHGEVRLAVGNLSDEEKSLHDESAFPLAYGICDFAPGEHMGQLEDEDRQHLIPAAVETMDRISLIDISDTAGWGWFDSEGNGSCDSWAEYVGSQEFPEGGGDFYARRRDWFDDGFLEFDVFRKFSDCLMSLVAGLPVIERSMVHIDFGWDNTLVVGAEVSVVIDWDNSIIGDHLYDGARSDLYSPSIDFKRLFAERYAATGRGEVGFDDRWLVCELHVALEALAWYGRSRNEAAYEWMKRRVLSVLGEGPSVGRHPSAF